MSNPSARHRNRLSLWVIYDHPIDYPNSFVARKFIVDAPSEPDVQPTTEVFICNSLEEVREAIGWRSLACMQRSPNDDPKILEIWI